MKPQRYHIDPRLNYAAPADDGVWVKWSEVRRAYEDHDKCLQIISDLEDEIDQLHYEERCRQQDERSYLR